MISTRTMAVTAVLVFGVWSLPATATADDAWQASEALTLAEEVSTAIRDATGSRRIENAEVTEALAAVEGHPAAMRASLHRVHDSQHAWAEVSSIVGGKAVHQETGKGSLWIATTPEVCYVATHELAGNTGGNTERFSRSHAIVPHWGSVVSHARQWRLEKRGGQQVTATPHSPTAAMAFLKSGAEQLAASIADDVMQRAHLSRRVERDVAWIAETLELARSRDILPVRVEAKQRDSRFRSPRPRVVWKLSVQDIEGSSRELEVEGMALHGGRVGLRSISGKRQGVSSGRIVERSFRCDRGAYLRRVQVAKGR